MLIEGIGYGAEGIINLARSLLFQNQWVPPVDLARKALLFHHPVMSLKFPKQRNTLGGILSRLVVFEDRPAAYISGKIRRIFPEAART